VVGGRAIERENTRRREYTISKYSSYSREIDSRAARATKQKGRKEIAKKKCTETG